MGEDVHVVCVGAGRVGDLERGISEAEDGDVLALPGERHAIRGD